MLLFSPPARHFVIPRVLPSFYHGVSGHCVISCMEKSQTFSRNGATGRGKLRERPEKIAPPPVFRLILPKVVDDPEILSNRHKAQARMGGENRACNKPKNKRPKQGA